MQRRENSWPKRNSKSGPSIIHPAASSYKIIYF
jgi:hypothetical protein